MSRAWENNPNGICEDAPCCGCCGPQGDGQIDDGPPDPDDFYDYDLEEEEDMEDNSDYGYDPGESPDPNWMNP